MTKEKEKVKIGSVVAFLHQPTVKKRVTKVIDHDDEWTMVELKGMTGQFNLSLFKIIKA